jgi:hypothetical protein
MLLVRGYERDLGELPPRRQIETSFPLLDDEPPASKILSGKVRGVDVGVSRKTAAIVDLEIGDLATIGAEVNTPDKLYDVEIDVGAMAPPQNQEQARNVTALIQSVAMLPPPVQQQIQWDQLMRMLMESLGQNPDRLINPMPPMGGGGEVPVGPPEPIG